MARLAHQISRKKRIMTNLNKFQESDEGDKKWMHKANQCDRQVEEALRRFGDKAPKPPLK
jgi:hypothetical protein